MANNVLSESVFKKVDAFLKESFGQDVKYEITGGASDSSSFLSDIFRIVIKSVNCKAENDAISKLKDETVKKFVLKVIRSTRVNKEVDFLSNSFIREIAVYSELFEEFHKMESDFGVPFSDRFNRVKVFLSSTEKGQEFLLMEDLHEIGYKMVDKFTPLDEIHLNMILKNLADFHALSFALKKYKPELFWELYPKVVACPVTDIECYIKLSNEKAINLLDMEADKIKLNDYLKCIAEKAKLTANEDKKQNPYYVLCHADCWLNNFMFKYEGNKNKNLSDVIILDWQVIGYSSPIQDVMHLMFLVTDGKFRKENYKKSLEKYYEYLGDKLTKLKLSTDEIYPREIFENDKIEYLKVAFGVTAGSLPFVLCDEDKKPKLDDVYGSDIDLSKVIYTDLINQRIKEGLQDILNLI